MKRGILTEYLTRCGSTRGMNNNRILNMFHVILHVAFVIRHSYRAFERGSQWLLSRTIMCLCRVLIRIDGFRAGFWKCFRFENGFRLFAEAGIWMQWHFGHFEYCLQNRFIVDSTISIWERRSGEGGRILCSSQRKMQMCVHLNSILTWKETTHNHSIGLDRTMWWVLDNPSNHKSMTNPMLLMEVCCFRFVNARAVLANRWNAVAKHDRDGERQRGREIKSR